MPKGSMILSEDNVRTNVRDERLTRGWSSAELARKLTDAGHGLGEDAIYKIEHGRRGISADEVIGFMLVFDVSFEYVTGDPVVRAHTDLMAALLRWSSMRSAHGRELSRMDREWETLRRHVQDLRHRSAEADQAYTSYIADLGFDELSASLRVWHGPPTEVKRSPSESKARSNSQSRTAHQVGGAQ